MKGFSLEKAVRDGFYFCSAVGRRSKPLWMLFFVMWGLSLSQTILSEIVQNNLLQKIGMVTGSESLYLQKVLEMLFSPTFILFFLGIALLRVIVQMILQKTAILSHRFSGEEIQPVFFKISWKVILNYFWLMFLFNLLVFGGLLLFIIPGIVWTYTYAFAPYMLLDKEKGTQYSFRMSRRLIDGLRWKYFLSVLLVSIVAGLLIAATIVPFESLLHSESMFSFVNVWSSLLSSFLVFYFVFFQASIYRQLVESIKFNPSIDREFAENYFVVRYNNEETEKKETPNEFSSIED
ncbi:MAG: YciC family protein [Caldisericia bacterium]|nr:YciC family protein [Caldisericia bacterium]